MFSVTSLGFLPFMALFVCLWYRVPQPSRWKLVLAANAVFCLSIDIGAFFAVALATAVVWQGLPQKTRRYQWKGRTPRMYLIHISETTKPH